MRRIFISVISLVFFLCMNTAVAIELSLVTDPWPPYNISASGNDRGLSIDIVTIALERAGYTTSVKLVPWSRAEQGVKKGAYDVLVGAWFTDERAKKLKFSTPYYENKIKFITTQKNINFSDLASLKNYKIGIVRGYAYAPDFNNATFLKKASANKLEINMDKLLLKRIDLTLADELVAKLLIRNSFDENKDKFIFLGKNLITNPLHIAVSKTRNDVNEISEKFNVALQEMKDDGTYEKIVSKYNKV